MESTTDLNEAARKVRSRRVLLAGPVGGLGAWLVSAAQRAMPAEAAEGDPVILGARNASGTNTTTIVSQSEFGTAFGVESPGTGLSSSGSLTGVWATSVEVGVEARGEFTTGVSGRSGWGDGMRAETTSPLSSAAGILAISNHGPAVKAKTEDGWAGWFEGRIHATSFIQLAEMATPSPPGANRARLFVRDNGSNHTQLCVRFPNGNIRVLATG